MILNNNLAEFNLLISNIQYLSIYEQCWGYLQKIVGGL